MGNRTGWVAACVLAAGCGGGFDPSGSYQGTSTATGESSRMLTDLQPDGTTTADTHRSNASHTDTTVTVRRIDERHLEMDLGAGCHLRLERMSDDDLGCTLSPEQHCPIEVEDVRGNVVVVGTVTLSRDPPSLNLMLNGTEQRGNPDRAGYVHVSWTYTFNGPRH